MPLDYETLRVIWWLLLGVLLIGLAVMDGFDMGVGALLPFVGRSDAERRVVINTVGPVWEGNQVWLILGAGAIFAAWPPLYAVAFSGFYLAMFVVLCALILRPVGFKFRSKIESPAWRSAWDWALFIGGFVPALIFGVAVGNAIVGAPFRFDRDLRIIYEGGFFDLLNPFALLCGLVSVAMLLLHGATYLALKTDGAVAQRARGMGQILAIALIILFAAGGYWAAGLEGYRIMGEAVTSGPSNPLYKEVVREVGALVANYGNYPWMMIAPALGFLGAALALLALRLRWEMFGFVASGAACFGIVSTAGVSMFPFLLPSSIMPGHSLTVWDSSSSHLTLFVMLIAVLIFLPIVLAYTAWVYRVLRGKVNVKALLRYGQNSY